MGGAGSIPIRVLVAIGGNAIHPEGILGTPGEQADMAARTAQAMLPLMRAGNQLIVTHGNGPVVGKILMRQAIARRRVAPMSLDICVAHSQGGVAYLLMQAFENALREVGDRRHVACLLTQVEVDRSDPAFANPTKPIGYFYSKDEADDLAREFGWTMREDSGRGWRHVVPSPEPRHIVDISLIRVIAENGAVVIAGGGGGIPVWCDELGRRHGLEAVIDKDLTSGLIANVLGIETLMILTSVRRVAIHFGTPMQREIAEAPLSQMRRWHTEGHFPPGSMGPKVAAAMRFVERGGKRAIVAHLDDALPALRGETGTHVVAG